MFLSLVSFRFVWGFVFFLFAQATNRSLHPGVFQPLSPPFPFSTPVVFSSHRPFGFCWAGMRRGGEEGTGRLVFHLQLSVQMPGLFCRSTANASLAGCFKQGNLKQNNNKKKKVTLSVRGERGGRREAHTCRDTARAAGLWLLPPPPPPLQGPPPGAHSAPQPPAWGFQSPAEPGCCGAAQPGGFVLQVENTHLCCFAMNTGLRFPGPHPRPWAAKDPSGNPTPACCRGWEHQLV